MKKLICFLLSATALMSGSAYARENTYAYNKHMANVLIPQQGLCDFSASFAGREVEYNNINDYFSGLISAFTGDFDGDGNDELVTVDSKMINVYSAAAHGVVYVGSFAAELIGNYNDSFSNVFLKELNGKKYICVENYFQTAAGNSYKFNMLSVDKENESIGSLISLEQTKDGENEYDSVSVNGISEYSYTVDGGISYSVNNNGYADYREASNAAFAKIGYAIEDVFIQTEQPDGNYRITKFLNDVEPMTYVRATGVRTGTPVVLFEDYSSLAKLSQPVDIISVMVNGEEIQFDTQDPMIIDGRTLVPVRGIFEALGAVVSWNGEIKQVTAIKDGVSIVMNIDSDKFYVNGEEKILDVPARIINDRTLVPVRAISESFGCNVEWDDTTKTVIIYN